MGVITYNTRLIFKDEKDKLAIFEILEKNREAWNFASKLKFDLKLSNNIVELHKAFYRKFRDSQPEIPAQILIRAEHEVLATYRSIKAKKHILKNAPVKTKLSMHLDIRTFSQKKKGTFSIISMGERVKCQPYLYPKLQSLLDKYPFCKGPELFVRNHEVWINLNFNIPELLSSDKLCLGVDLGIKNFAATSDGKLFRDKGFNARKRRLRHLKSRLQTKGTKSAKRHLLKLRRKEKNINHNFTHHLANAILKTKADTIAIENLKGIKAKKHKFQNKNRISQVPLFKLREVLSYKAQLLNKKVITVNPAYTSQIDHRTGLKDGIRQGSRYTGKDGKQLHADVNAACNIAVRSKLPPLIGNYFEWQAYVNEPIVNKVIHKFI